MNPLETKLEDLTTDIQKVSDSNVSRVLTQQEVTDPMADDAADYNVKVTRQLATSYCSFQTRSIIATNLVK